MQMLIKAVENNKAGNAQREFQGGVDSNLNKMVRENLTLNIDKES